jgi:hypothetical protein
MDMLGIAVKMRHLASYFIVNNKTSVETVQLVDFYFILAQNFSFLSCRYWYFLYGDVLLQDTFFYGDVVYGDVLLMKRFVRRCFVCAPFIYVYLTLAR